MNGRGVALSEAPALRISYDISAPSEGCPGRRPHALPSCAADAGGVWAAGSWRVRARMQKR